MSLHKTCNTNEPVGSGALREGVQEADDGDEQFGWEASESVGWYHDTASHKIVTSKKQAKMYGKKDVKHVLHFH